MTVPGISVISLGLLACSLVACNAGTVAKKFGRHEFPLVTLAGKQTANEFQLIQPNKIVDGRSKAGNGDSAIYILSSISPLSIDNDDVVTVKFESSKPSSKDWIGAYSPANVDITTTVPVKFGYCDEWDDYITNGEGKLTFNFTNLRSDIAFYYFTNDVDAPIMMNTSTSIVKFKNYNEPLRPRVVPTGDVNVFNLLWSSASSTKPTLKWGTASGKYDNIVTATTQELQKSDFCGSPANGVGYRELGQIHTAAFTGLKELANKKVYYIFGDEATDDYSKQYVLHVPPLAGTQPSGRGTTVVLYDDLGRGSTDMTYTWNEYGRPAIYTLYSVGNLVKNGKIDAVYHGGDISYATGYLAVWDFFLDELSPVASGIPYLTTVGNHESDWYDSASLYSNGDSGGECGVATTRLIPMPEPATTNKPWWSYDVGLIHMIGMSTEHDYAPGSEQYKWLENDLASVDRKKTPWIVFGGHRAMYLNSYYGGSETSDVVVSQQMVSYLEPLLYKYRVNIGFYGHNHVVQRQSAVLNYTVVQASKNVTDSNGNVIHLQEDPQATVHFVVGTGGAAFTKTATTPPPVWNEMFFYQYGYAIVTAVNESYLDWQWILSSTNEVLDHVVITQSDPTQPWKSSVKV